MRSVAEAIAHCPAARTMEAIVPLSQAPAPALGRSSSLGPPRDSRLRDTGKRHVRACELPGLTQPKL